MKEGCHRCGHWPAQLVQLAGGYAADMCARCTNEWGDMIKSDPVWNEYRDVDLEFQVRVYEIGTRGEFNSRRDLLIALRDQSDNLRDQLKAKAALFVLKCNVPAPTGN